MTGEGDEESGEGGAEAETEEVATLLDTAKAPGQGQEPRERLLWTLAAGCMR